MRYLPLTPQEEKEILALCKESSFETLTREIPESLRVKGLLNLPHALSENEVIDHVQCLGEKNTASKMLCLLGQGAYDHSWPVAIDYLVTRGEFLTAYTPYQPEVSQGTLQAIFEFQSMISNLFGMEVSNASLYDGSTSLVEAALMAARLQNKSSGKFLISEGVFDQTQEILKTHLEPLGFELVVWTANPDGSSSAQIPKIENVCGVIMQSPNKWGVVEDWDLLKKTADTLQTKSIAHVAHTHSLALYASPGEKGIDIASGEGQSLGIPLGFGGPYLGLFTCNKKDVRQMPGRLVGKTVDARSREAFCVTLSTREQHIRRDKATSNICSNQGLMALRASIYLSLMGPQGLLAVAQASHQAADTLRKKVSNIIAPFASDLSVVKGEVFNEWSLFYSQKFEARVNALITKAEKEGILLGVKTKAPTNSGFKGALSIAFTERFKMSDCVQLEKLFSEVFV